MCQKTHEGNHPATVTTAMLDQESETITSFDPGRSVVPAFPDHQQEEERENEHPCWDGYESEDKETEVFNDETAQALFDDFAKIDEKSMFCSLHKLFPEEA